MLNQFILPDGLMAMNAEGLLKILGKPALPMQDILIRESIQNSLDAAVSDQDPVTISFDWIKYNSTNDIIDLFKKNLDGDRGILNRLYARAEKGLPAILTIRDIGTTGLTGPTRKSDNEWNLPGKKNFRDLVYQIGRHYDIQGSGGSYGFGKTIFYKISSCGLILYYTRCQIENRFEERLIFCSVSENEQQDGKNTGIIWWGDEVYEYGGTGYIAPLTEQQKIDVVLHSFGIKKFDDNETGTLIGIISPSPGSLSISESDDQNSRTNPDKTYSLLSENFKESILKWYWPRIIKHYEHLPHLSCKVDGFAINPIQTKYKIYMDLLIGADKANATLVNSSEKKFLFKNDTLTPVSFEMNEFMGVFLFPVFSLRPYALIGTLAVLAAEDLPKNNFINKVAMMRRPKMIVYYSENEMPISKSKDVIALFLVNSDFKVRRNNVDSKNYIMDDAFRYCEDPSHNTWNYETLVDTDKWFKSYIRISKRKIKDILTDFLNVEKTYISDKIMSEGAITLGNLLIPNTQPLKFGSSAGIKKGKTIKTSKAFIVIVDHQFESDDQLKIKILIKNLSIGKFRIDLFAVTESGTSFDNIHWIQDGLSNFPFSFYKVPLSIKWKSPTNKTEQIGECKNISTFVSNDKTSITLENNEHITELEQFLFIQIHGKDSRLDVNIKDLN